MRFMPALGLVFLLALPGFAQEDCSKLREPLCLVLKNTLLDSTRLEVSILFPSPSKPGRGDSLYWSNLGRNLAHFFTTYDIRDRSGQRMSLPDPLDNWEFRDVRATKHTLIGLSQESYLWGVELYSWGGPGCICNKISGHLCRQVLGGADSSALYPFQVFFPYPADAGPNSAYKAELKSQVVHFFSTYDIRDSLGQRLAAPDSVDIGIFVALHATRNTILNFAKEAYVREVETWVLQGPLGGTFREALPSWKADGRRNRYRVDGRRNPPHRRDSDREAVGRR